MLFGGRGRGLIEPYISAYNIIRTHVYTYILYVRMYVRIASVVLYVYIRMYSAVSVSNSTYIIVFPTSYHTDSNWRVREESRLTSSLSRSLRAD